MYKFVIRRLVEIWRRQKFFRGVCQTKFDVFSLGAYMMDLLSPEPMYCERDFLWPSDITLGDVYYWYTKL
jgi:hypothetical protein